MSLSTPTKRWIHYSNFREFLTSQSIYLDDILVRGEIEAYNLQTLEKVLKCLAKAGLRVMCQFIVDSVEYGGHYSLVRPFLADC